MKHAKISAMALFVLMVGSSAAAFVGGFDPTDPADADRDADGDGLSNIVEYYLGTDPSNPDSDGGGTPDGWEYDNGLDPTSRLDDLGDSDGDDWDAWDEFVHGTNPNKMDTDDDGIKDSTDPNPLFPDGDWINADGGFGMGDGGTEGQVPGGGMGAGSGSGSGQGSGSGSGSGSGQGQGQGNGQGQGAGQGAGQGFGNGQGAGQGQGSGDQPSDTDGDGIDDGTEDANGNGQCDPTETCYEDPDTDHDGLRDREEAGIGGLGLDPTNPDTDGDGLSDGSEVRSSRTDPLDKDSDDDLLWDSEETGPLSPNSDVAGIFCRMCMPPIPSPNTFGRAGINPDHFTGTDPLMYSTANDGVSDAFADEDSDLLSNINEVKSSYSIVLGDGTVIPQSDPNWGKSDPQKADTDCDNLWDGWEVVPQSAPPGKTTPYASDPNDADTDNDGLTDDVDPNPVTSTILSATRIFNVRVNGQQLDGVRSVNVVKQTQFMIDGEIEYQNPSTSSWYPVEADKPMDVYIYLVQWNGSGWVPHQLIAPIQTATGSFGTPIRITSDDIRAGPGYLFVQTDIHNRDPTQVFYARTQWTEPNAPAFTIPPLSVCTQ